MDTAKIDRLRRALAPKGHDTKAYVVLDGAAIERLPARLHQPDCPPFRCLFTGDLTPDMTAVAPYVLPFEPETSFGQWVTEGAWSRHWGIVIHTDADLATLWRHLRTIVKVYDADGKPLFFRFYDPRVLHVFLPTCSNAQLGTLFGPIARFLCEGENGMDVVAFSTAGTGLISQVLLEA
jgi:hypothetical protein